MRKPPRALTALLVAACLAPFASAEQEKAAPACSGSEEARRALRKAFVSNLSLKESSGLVDALEKKSQEPVPAAEGAAPAAPLEEPCTAKEIEALRKQIAAVADVQRHPMLDTTPGKFEGELNSYARQIHEVAESLRLEKVEEIPVGRAYANLKIPAERKGAVSGPSEEMTKRLEESRRNMMTTERRLNLNGLKDVFGQARQAGEIQDASAGLADGAAALPGGVVRPDALLPDVDHHGRPGPNSGRGLDAAPDGIDRVLAARAPKPVPAAAETAEQAGVKHLQAAENPDIAFVERWMHGGAAKGDALVEGVREVASGDKAAVARAGEGAIAGTAEILTQPAADVTRILEKHFNPQGVIAQGAPLDDRSAPVEAVENIPADPALARAKAEKRRYVNMAPEEIKKRFGPAGGNSQPTAEGDARANEGATLDEAARSRAQSRQSRYINTDPATIKKRFGGASAEEDPAAGDSSPEQ